MIDLQKVKDWGDVLIKWVTVIAILIGGWWAYHNYSIADTAEINPIINVSAEVLPYNNDSRLLVTHIKPDNVGVVPVELTGGKIGGDISITISKIPPDLSQGRIEASKLSQLYGIKSLVAENDGSYIIEPHARYDDVRVFVVPKGQTYFIHTEMVLPNESGNPEDEESVDSSFVIEAKAKPWKFRISG
jgi:hypothetical protein